MGIDDENVVMDAPFLSRTNVMKRRSAVDAASGRLFSPRNPATQRPRAHPLDGSHPPLPRAASPPKPRARSPLCTLAPRILVLVLSAVDVPAVEVTISNGVDANPFDITAPASAREHDVLVEFLTLLAVCYTVIPELQDGKMQRRRTMMNTSNGSDREWA
ncbi:hypothetical protein HETIRDRAFT_109330 [Heterobasidion irregulare TC 32-1]|uniref:Uncharacterized protein n=1 Tax=Heterobasidion irregulare (strain TC 32-1) TaxID=747525 RepID=W4JQ28_HETIT|nr:uncharacterized protein HETIRDRAFT_109330 [Heterobasidion irregulare TC 32-1]ETW75638.1 hypothetical protein HETIRDRAFT_109330 [Heterobasidion irregulare TC 32-1]